MASTLACRAQSQLLTLDIVLRVMVVVSVEMDDGVQADVWLDRDEIVSITVTEQRLVKVPS